MVCFNGLISSIKKTKICYLEQLLDIPEAAENVETKSE